jgi:hypothetical protein
MEEWERAGGKKARSIKTRFSGSRGTIRKSPIFRKEMTYELVCKYTVCSTEIRSERVHPNPG